jgi:hypothetical protein
MVIRLRHHLSLGPAGSDKPLLAEDALLAAFRGAPDAPEWVPDEQIPILLKAEPSASMHDAQKTQFLGDVLDHQRAWRPHLNALAAERAAALEAAHRRVRQAARASRRLRVRPQLPIDILGIYILLPAPVRA